MKSTHMFRDQVNTVTNWFQGWNECEQTVALYSLLRKLPPVQARFLQQVLEQSLTQCSDVQVSENQANSPAFINSLCNVSKENAMTQLLRCLPLLRQGNAEAKVEYLKIIPKILAHSIENGCHIEESRQLLSYSLIHPAINTEERSQFTMWLGHLEERFTHGVYTPAPLSSSNMSKGGRMQGMSDMAQDIFAAGSVQYTEKNGQQALPSGLATHGQAGLQQGVQGLNGWQQVASRDSGIALGELDTVGSSTAPLTAAGGRPITSSSTASSGLGDSPAADSQNGAGLTVKEHAPLHATLSGPAAFNSVPSSQGGTAPANGHRRLTRSASATPPAMVAAMANSLSAFPHVSDWLHKHQHQLGQAALGRSQSAQSLPREQGHPPLSPQSSITSSGSGSDTHPADQLHPVRNTFLQERSGMRDVPIWLKNLRLHKYAYLFQQMNYDEMLGLTEEWLEEQNVTKGARNKIMLSIRKLRERPNSLRSMEKDIMESGNLKQALTEIKSMLNTPLKNALHYSSSQSADEEAKPETSSNTEDIENKPPEVTEDAVIIATEANNPPIIAGTESDAIPEDDLPGQLTRVIGKMCTQLLVTTRPEDDCFALYLQLLDKCMMHEAFSADQKRKLLSWKQQIQKVWQPQHQKFCIERHRKTFGIAFPTNIIRGQRALRGQQPQPKISKPGQPKWTFNSHPAVTIAGGIAVPPPTNLPLYPSNALNLAFASRPTAVFDIAVPKQPVARTHSAPIKSSQYGLSLTPRPVQDMSVTEPELTARLDSLCLSMTEHALGGLDNPDRGATF